MYHMISLFLLLTTPRVVLEELQEKKFEICWHESLKGTLVPSKDVIEITNQKDLTTKTLPFDNPNGHYDYIHCMYEGEQDPRLDFATLTKHLLVYNQRVETNAWREGRHED